MFDVRTPHAVAMAVLLVTALTALFGVTADALTRDRARPPDPALTEKQASRIVGLAGLRRARFALGRGDRPEAEGLVRDALDLLEFASGARSIELADPLMLLAELTLGRNDEAERAVRRALDLRVAHLGQNDPAVAESRFLLAGIRAKAGDSDAVAKFGEALGSLQRSHPEEDRVLLAQVSRWPAGFSVPLLQALEVWCAREAPNKPGATELDILDAQTVEYHRAGLTDEARAVANERVKLGELNIKDDPIALGRALARRGWLESELGEHVQGIGFLEKSLEMFPSGGASTVAETREALEWLVATYAKAGDPKGVKKVEARLAKLDRDGDRKTP